MFVCQISMFLSIFKWFLLFVKREDGVSRKQDFLVLRSGFMRRRLVLSVGFEDLVNMFAGGDRDEVRGLFNLNTLVVINETHVGKRGLVITREHKARTNDIIDSFGNVFVRAAPAKFPLTNSLQIFCKISVCKTC